jgi:catechol 2,3-dioxygenase-like lactoylglutathione lyase family enzyme
VEFYTQVLGLREGRRGTIAGSWIDAVVGLRDVEAEFVSLEPPASGTCLELIHYGRPAMQRPADLGRSNLPGLRHLAFAVSDIDAVVVSLRRARVRLLSEVQTHPPERDRPQKLMVYFQDPEGNLLELCEYRQVPPAHSA